jgi:PRTRC genetic system protein C
MPIHVETITRKFVWRGTELPDPNPQAAIEAVRDILSHTHPEIANAAVEGPRIKGAVHTFTFIASVGEKG